RGKIMKDIKTLVFDMDGTILNEKKELDSVLQTISPRLQAQNLQLIIATGRLTYMTYVYLNELKINHVPIIACNGAQIAYRDQKEPVFAAIFPLETTYKLIEKATKLGLLYHVFTLEGLVGVEHAGRLAY